ncbi:PilZ domain-containing protein [Duganella sp. HH101]|uniref:PilZ domain-containing protein n=1 Tax=Duganella sp. HH101 TaxID=1781066 RepID=UPI000892AA1F|nr:PilZ domain-containing protein [Duganella sp. HH101]OFA04133.1 PilZ domain protein [Duganella sp. HH101]
MLVDQRSVARKIVRAKAVVIMDGMPPLQGRTIDISAQGLSLNFEHKLGTGHMGQLSFELFIDGKAQLLTCRSKVTYCIFSGDHFKIGYQFLNLDSITSSAITKFLR